MIKKYKYIHVETRVQMYLFGKVREKFKKKKTMKKEKRLRRENIYG